MAIRNYSATVPIFFYIGDLPKAMKKLSQSMLNINTISIGDSPKSIESFLKANLTDVIWLFFIQYNTNANQFNCFFLEKMMLLDKSLEMIMFLHFSWTRKVFSFLNRSRSISFSMES